MHVLLGALLVLLVPASSSGGVPVAPELVKDLNKASESSFPHDFTTVGSELWFGAYHPTTGEEIYRVTAEGTTEMVVDARPGTESVNPEEFVVRGDGVVFFRGGFRDYPGYNRKAFGDELWRTDGTPEGTLKLAHFTDDYEHPIELTVVGDRVFFVVDDLNGETLWVTDGTVDGTRIVPFKQDDDDEPGEDARDLVAFKGKLFFRSYGAKGGELYRSDGSASGTKMVKNIARYDKNGGLRKSSDPSDLTVLNNRLYFTAHHSRFGHGLWKTNGTRRGTKAVKHFCLSCGAGPKRHRPNALTKVGAKLYLSADDGTHGRELWRSDGSASGTRMVANINPRKPGGSDPGSKPHGFTRAGGLIYFSATRDDVDRELFRTDGTRAGTKLVEDIAPHVKGGTGGIEQGSLPTELTNHQGHLLFRVRRPSVALWRSDGTAGSTRKLSGPRQAPHPEIALHQGLAFVAVDEPPLHRNAELWASDGTKDGTSLYAEINDATLGSRFKDSLAVDADLYFVSTGRLFVTDGTEGGTLRLNPDFPPYDPHGLSEYEGMVLFVDHKDELWRTDGTVEGTKHLRGGLTVLPRGSDPEDFDEQQYAMPQFNGDMFFGALDVDLNEPGLYKTDGTSGGTNLIKTFDRPPPGWGREETPQWLTVVGDALYFVVGRDLWVTDGTSDGTVPVKRFDPIPNSFSDPVRHLTDLDGMLLFGAYSDETGFSLWKSDGTETGTETLEENFGGTSRVLTAAGDAYFFASKQGASSQLWESDGTSDGTESIDLGNINVLADYVGGLESLDGSLFFKGHTSEEGVEIRRLDLDTREVTTLTDIDDSDDGVVRHLLFGPLTVNDDLLYFTADGSGLWQTDGTPEGTKQIVPDLFPDDRFKGAIRHLEFTDSVMFFDWEDTMHGRELFKLPLLPLP